MERRGFGWGLPMAGVCEFPAAGAKFPAIPAGPISDDRDFRPISPGRIRYPGALPEGGGDDDGDPDENRADDDSHRAVLIL